MTKKDILFNKISAMANYKEFMGLCEDCIDTDEKIEEMLNGIDNGIIKTSDDVIEKILEFEYGYEAVHGRPRG